MGVENNECVIATTFSDEAMKKVKDWVLSLSDDYSGQFSFLPSLVNSKQTVFLAPDGSKGGWKDDQIGDKLRAGLIALIKTMDYKDGSNPFEWVEVQYGDTGQRILSGNCVNRYLGDES